MLTREENELLTRVGVGTPMGDLMRQYWIPVLLSSELQAGHRTKRVRLLGEDLVAFRTPGGKVGLMNEFCPHRRASLYFGRIEETGLRCVYHGWQFALDGQCRDMPNEPVESEFKEKVCLSAYPCAERGGVVWTYMGSSSTPPGLPDLEWTLVPDENRLVSKFYQYCNYFQALESGIDPSHVSFLHGILSPDNTDVLRDLEKAEAGFGLASRLARAPYLEVADTDYGALLGARRDTGEGTYYWRITQFHMPFHTMPPTEATADPILQSHMWIPVDDEHLVNWCISWHPTRELSAEERAAARAGLGIHIMNYAPPTNEAYGDIRPLAAQQNDYLIDWEAHHNSKFFGVPGVGAQDKAITESQTPIYDRTQERLGRSDIGIIRIRKCLMDAALALKHHGTPPPGLASESHLIRPASVLLPQDVPWAEGAKTQLTAAVPTHEVS